jgi:23S rRNA pseudouridine2605 synthase
MHDTHSEKTVIELLEMLCLKGSTLWDVMIKKPQESFPTNDGELAGRLTHPRYDRKKIYHAGLDKPVTKEDMYRLVNGIDLEGDVVVADSVAYIDPLDKTNIGLELHSGKNRVVRKMFETLGYRVKKLDRVYFAGLTKKNVPRGKWRFLTIKEINMLKRGIF